MCTYYELTGFVKCKSKYKEIKTKDDFKQLLSQYEWIWSKINPKNQWVNIDYLIYSRRDTVKWRWAQINGVKCITYQEALDIIERRELFKMI